MLPQFALHVNFYWPEVCQCFNVWMFIPVYVRQEGKTWSPPGNKCERYTCVKFTDTLTTFRSNIICPPFDESNCYPVGITVSD